MVSRSELALSFFRPHGTLGCGQSVLKAFCREIDAGRFAHRGLSCDSGALLEAAGVWSGGGCEEGWCGAVRAAKALLDEAQHPTVDEAFRAAGGDNCCDELREYNRMSCQACVALGVELVDRLAKV
jgi:hypothetical protein